MKVVSVEGGLKFVGAIVVQAVNDMSEHLRKQRRCGGCQGPSPQKHLCCYQNTCSHEFGSARDFLFRKSRLEDFFITYGLDIAADYVRDQSKKQIRNREVVETLAFN